MSDAARYRFVPPERVPAEYAAARSSAERASALAQDTVLALKAHSSIHHRTGNYATAEDFGRRALALDPNDPDTRAQVGWRLAMHHFLEGDPARMLEFAAHSAAMGSGFGSFLVAVAAGELGDAGMAATALFGMEAMPSLALDPDAFMHLGPDGRLRKGA